MLFGSSFVKSSLFIISILLVSVSANAQKTTFTLQDFYTYHPELEQRTAELFDTLAEEHRIAQLIMTSIGRLGKPDEHVKKLVANNQVGGVLLLNGSIEGFSKTVADLDELTKKAEGVPLLYSADAEPSLVNRKIAGSQAVPRTVNIKDQKENQEVAQTIAQDLKKIGVSYNFAPDCDLSNENAAIGNRSYGSSSERVVPMAWGFINVMQQNQIAGTAKHFPGHGRVAGDTHKQLVYINGEMTELNTYVPLIDSGVISVMVGHIAVENNKQYNTKGQPATLSRVIVTNLLKNEMNFRGIIVTDAMNMGAVSKIPHSGLKALQAGCDIVLMPIDEQEVMKDVLDLMQKDPAFRQQIDASVRKVLRLKICLGLL